MDWDDATECETSGWQEPTWLGSPETGSYTWLFYLWEEDPEKIQVTNPDPTDFKAFALNHYSFPDVFFHCQARLAEVQQ